MGRMDASSRHDPEGTGRQGLDRDRFSSRVSTAASVPTLIIRARNSCYSRESPTTVAENPGYVRGFDCSILEQWTVRFSTIAGLISRVRELTVVESRAPDSIGSFRCVQPAFAHLTLEPAS
jgi:hypothetical protein